MLPRSNLDRLSVTKRVSEEEAQKVIRLLRQIADTAAAHAAFHTTGRRKVSIEKLMEPLAISIRLMYLPQYESRAMGEIDRLGSMVGGLPYLTDEFPWLPPVRKEFKIPLCQLDLGEISRVTGTDVGDGLLQLWRWAAGDWCFGESELRHIPAAAVRRNARLLDMPEPLAAQLSAEWQHNIVGARLLEELFEEESEDKGDYFANLYLQGLLWGDGDLEHMEVVPWWAGGEYAGDGPWQIVDWVSHGYSLPFSGFVEQILFDAETTDDELSGDPEFDRLRSEVLKMSYAADEKWKSLEEEVKCRDSLFGITLEQEESSNFGLVPLVGNWQPLFNLYGPATGSLFTESCNIYYRRLRGKFKYRVWSDGYRSG